MTYQEILAELKEGTFYVTINRPQKLNALNGAVLKELAHAIAFANESAAVKAVLITGAGEKAFVAGADISEFQNYNLEEGKQLAKIGQDSVFDAIENCTKPVIAAINGFALGGGLELAMACHIRIASENAKLGLPEVTLGLIPGYGGTQRLAQLVGKGRALEMIFTADMITAENLNEAAAKRYIAASLKREYASENGTELNAILPKLSPLNPQYLTKKQSVLQKIAAFVEKFKGVGGKV